MNLLGWLNNKEVEWFIFKLTDYIYIVGQTVKGHIRLVLSSVQFINYRYNDINRLLWFQMILLCAFYLKAALIGIYNC